MSKPEDVYQSDFYARQSQDSLRSARAFLSELFVKSQPTSIVDVGCGVGTWLRAAADLGVGDYAGLDGHNLPASSLLIDGSRYRQVDFTGSSPDLGRRFDLAMSLEVAEHLPEVHADRFVSLLASLSDEVLFSAAIPGQGGRHHVNEQFPSYWIRKFAAHGFRCFDFLRPMLWGRGDVDVWYRQNVIFFSRYRDLPGELPSPEAYDRVHPDVWGDPKLVTRRIRRGLRNRVRAILGGGG